MRKTPLPEGTPLRVSRCLPALVLFLLCGSSPLRAARYRVVDAKGKPVPAARVSILGRAGSVAADPQGVLTLESEPAPPFEIGVFSPSGEWLGSVRVERLPRKDSSIRDLSLPEARSTEVLVSAATAPSLLAPPADPVSLIWRREWKQRSPNRLTEIIETLPGVSKTDESTSSVPVIRGLARGRTLVMLDDGRVAAERRVGPSASYLNPFALENVEVVRGPGTVAYGSDALGGVVHAKTPMPMPSGFGVRYMLAAGTGGTPETTGGVGFNVPVGPTALALSLYQRAQSDYESPVGTQDNSAARDRGLSVRWLVPAGATRLWVGYQVDQVRDMGKPQADLPTTRTFYPVEDSSRVTLGLDAPDVLGFSSVELRAFGGDYRIVTNRQRRPVGTTLRNSLADVDAKDFSLRLLGRRAVGPVGLRVGVDVNGRFGLEALNITENFNAAGLPTTATVELAVEDARRTDWGAFVEGDVPLVADRLTLTAGLRGDHVSTRNAGGYFGDRSTSNGALAGFAALSFVVATDWEIAAQCSRGFRDPTLSDRYFRGVSGRGFVVGNPDLLAETANQWDLSVRGRLGPVSLRLSGYVYRIADLVERYRSGDDNLFRNRGEAEIAGAELEADYRLSSRLVVRVTGSLSQGKVLDDGSFATDILPPTAQIIVDHEPINGLYLRARFIAMARDDRPGAAEVPIAGYGRLDLSAGFRVSDFLSINISVRNVFDKAYADSADENNNFAPGRGAIVSLSGKF